MKTAIESQIKERITSFVSELDILVRKSTLDALKGILDAQPGTAVRRGRGPGRPRGSGRASGNVDAAAEAMLAYVRQNDGQGVREIAAATGTPPAVAKKAAVQLLASGQLKKSGVRRGTVYHLGSGRPARVVKGKRGKRGKRRGRKTKAA
jgi:hypothetical protein